MNQLTWLFKRFPFSKSNRKSRTVFGAVLGGIIILGCQNLLQTPRSAVSSDENGTKLVLFSSSVKVYLKTDQVETFVGEFDKSSCSNGFPALWSSTFQSGFGEHRFDFDFTPLLENKSKEILVKAPQQRFQLQLDGVPVALREQKLCDLPLGTDKVVFARESAPAAEFVSLLQFVSPDCQFSASKEGVFACQLEYPNDRDLLTHLTTLTKNMSTRWNHQPYLLIRRLTLTTQLFDAYTSKDQKDMQNICRIIEYSLPYELPLSFRSKTWQQKVCREKQPDKDLVMTGLDQAAREIDALAKRIEGSSLIGLFTLSVPRDKSYAKEYWISLQPLEQTDADKKEVANNTACVWHPLFSDQQEKELIAVELGQIQSTGRASCIPMPALARAKKEASTYIRASMASEMEFQISNGQSKMLRLPTGDYKYSITQFNGVTSEETFSPEEIQPLSIGQVSWKNNRPHLLIKSW